MISPAASDSARKRTMSPIEVLLRVFRYAGIMEPAGALEMIKQVRVLNLKKIKVDPNKSTWEAYHQLTASGVEGFFDEVENAFSLMEISGDLCGQKPSEILGKLAGYQSTGSDGLHRQFLYACVRCRSMLFEQFEFLEQIQNANAKKSVE